MVMTENKPIRSGSSCTNFPITTVQSEIFLHSKSAQVDISRFSVEIITFLEKTQIPESDNVLQRSLVAEVLVTKEGYVIRSSYIDEEAYGHTFPAAYIDFLTSIHDRYRSLCRREKRLSLYDRSILGRLRTLLEPS